MLIGMMCASVSCSGHGDGGISVLTYYPSLGGYVCTCKNVRTRSHISKGSNHARVYKRLCYSLYCQLVL